MSEAPLSGPTDVDGAVSRLSALFRSEQPTPPETEQNAKPTKVQDYVEETADNGDTEPTESRYKVKVDGEELEVTLDELQKGFMMGKDYTRKTMSLAEQRKQVEAKIAEIDANLEEAKSVIDLELDWFDSSEAKELRQYDPDEYLKRFEKIKGKADKFQKLKAKRESEMTAVRQEQLKKEQELLRQKIPDWMDETTVQREYPKLVESMKSVGFDDNELTGISDHRMMVLARKAMLYDQIMSQDISGKKVKTPPKSATPGTPKSPTEAQDRKIKEMRERLRKKGDMSSASAAIRSMLFK
jgi:hypothetical protein